MSVTKDTKLETIIDLKCDNSFPLLLAPVYFRRHEMTIEINSHSLSTRNLKTSPTQDTWWHLVRESRVDMTNQAQRKTEYGNLRNHKPLAVIGLDRLGERAFFFIFCHGLGQWSAINKSQYKWRVVQAVIPDLFSFQWECVNWKIRVLGNRGGMRSFGHCVQCHSLLFRPNKLFCEYSLMQSVTRCYWPKRSQWLVIGKKLVCVGGSLVCYGNETSRERLFRLLR